MYYFLHKKNNSKHSTMRKNPASRKKPEEDIPRVLTATRVPLCHVLVRFFPRMVIPTFSSSSIRFGFGWVMAWDGACDTNTVGAEPWIPETYKCTNKWISMTLPHKIWYKDHHICSPDWAEGCAEERISTAPGEGLFTIRANLFTCWVVFCKTAEASFNW